MVGTPAYAAREITSTPMQTPEGTFVPQEKGYLGVVAEHLVDSFLEATGVTGAHQAEILVVHKGAQRWGSAMPAPRHLATDESSPTRRVICSVPYDTGRGCLAPTTECREGNTFYVDKELGLLQIGDFVGSHTPGMESSVLWRLRRGRFRRFKFDLKIFLFFIFVHLEHLNKAHMKLKLSINYKTVCFPLASR